MIDLLARLNGVAKSGEGWTARCPAHDDHHSSLSIACRDGRWLLKCHAGCDWQEVVGALGIAAEDLFDDPPRLRGGGSIPRSIRATAQPSGHSGSPQSVAAGLTLEQYASAKRLPVALLKECGISEFTFDHRPALRIPYLGGGGEELSVRFRIGLEGDRFRWKSGSRPCLYGLHRLADARQSGQVVLVEGESDCHTLWHHGIAALAVPGATNWREERDAPHLEGFETIYVVIEADRGGEAVRKWLSKSAIRHRVKLLSLPEKDPSAMHLKGPKEFPERWRIACLGALPWTTVEAEASAAERTEAWTVCGDLARKSNILNEFDGDLNRLGLVGERRAAKLVYLAVVSRLLDRPVSLAVKGPSSGGKSFVVESALKFFPPEAFYALTAMSDRALAYSAEPLRHRHLVLYEAAGMASDFATYLIRSLLSEGRLRYETVDKTKDGLVPRLIEREGPTGLIVTTTSLRLHPENETRMLSLTITDTSDQTAAVFRALAQDTALADIDLTRWHALQVWLATGPNAVVVPFAKRLAELVPPVAIRLRRDFKTVLMLIRAHALLHQASRLKDESGRVVATLRDYAAVQDLVADLVAEGVEATVKPEVRETVEAVGRLIAEGSIDVRQTELRAVFKLDRSVISRRVGAALDGGFLKNNEDRKGRPARLVLGDPLPADLEVLPAPNQLELREPLHGCARDPEDMAEGDLPPDAAQDNWLERAAIAEFDGGLSRDRAEAMANRQLADDFGKNQGA
jgi:hypothetical protein